MIEQDLVRLGTPTHVFRIKNRARWFFLGIATVATAAATWGLVRVDAPVCTVAPLFIFGWVTIEFFTKRRTVLSFFENGLQYHRLFRKHTVFWDDIEEFGHILGSDYDTADLRDNEGRPLDKVRSIRRGGDHIWIQTFEGEKFYLRPDLESVKEIIDLISLKLFDEPYYDDGPNEVYTSRKITRREIDG